MPSTACGGARIFTLEQAMRAAIFDIGGAGLRTKQWIDSARGVKSLGFRGGRIRCDRLFSQSRFRSRWGVRPPSLNSLPTPPVANRSVISSAILRRFPVRRPFPNRRQRRRRRQRLPRLRQANPRPKGYTGAYAPAGTPPTPYSTGPLPQSSAGPGLNTVAPDGVSTRTVKAVPCGTVARETDGTTTCVGIPDRASGNQSPGRRRR